MTKLAKPISRETARVVRGRPVIVTVAPCGSQSEARIGFRLKGERTQYVALVSDLYRMAALWHGQREAAARRKARHEGESWRNARKHFIAANTI
jgi:hypothetical protein